MMVDPDELRLLADVGLIAALQGDLAAADGIFRAVESERPAAAVSYIGPAVARLCLSQPAAAIECLQRGLKKVPLDDQSELHAVLGVAYQIDGQSAASHRALRAAGDLPLARAMLDRIKPSPLGA